MPALRVLLVGKSRTDWANEAVAEYVKRLSRYGGAVEDVLKAEVFRGDVEAVRTAEGERLLATLGPRDRLVACDERGKGVDTEAFARMIDEGRQAGPLVFAIGGAYGFPDAVRARAWKVVRLSDLVLNHEVARVVLWEQLYRGMSLLHGAPYHHA